MNQIYVSGPWSFSSGVVKSIKTKSKDKVVYSEKGEDYQEVCSQSYCGA